MDLHQTNATSTSSVQQLTNQLIDKKSSLLDEARPFAVEMQHKKGKLTARERLNALLDKDSFIEYGMLVDHKNHADQLSGNTPADGIIVGLGEVNGRTVAVGASDYTVLGGSIGFTGMKKLERIVKLAKDSGFPVVLLLEGGGHRIQEGLDSREVAKFAQLTLFVELSLLSGWVPLISAIMGPGFAGPSNLSALCDFVPIVKNATMGIAGPKLVKAAIGEDLTGEQLGGAKFHTEKTGMADLIVENDLECILQIKRFLSYLPSNANELVAKRESSEPVASQDKEWIKTLPDAANKVYDMKKILKAIMDEHSIYELKPHYAKNIITAFATIDGSTVGVIANQTLHAGGVLDAAACTKAARFTSLCDAYNIPIISFIDLPGFLPGSQSEQAGLVRKSGKLQYELARVTVPRITIVVRKAYGFAFMVMAAGSDYLAAWPTAEICAMSIEGAVDVAFHSDYENADNPLQKRQEIIQHYKKQTGAMYAAEDFGIDDVIEPFHTRAIITKMLRHLPIRTSKQVPPRKHGIAPI